MFTDLVGYSALAQADEAAALAALDRHNRLLRPLFGAFRGREIKSVGDAFLVEFESALDAVRCALDIQRSLHDYNATSSDPWKIRIRIGIHVGDVVEADGDVLGDAVNIASRILSLAEPEGICLTQQVVDQVQNKLPVALAKLPPVALKNIRTALSVYRVVDPPAAIRAPVRPAGGVPRGRQLAVLPLVNISPDPGDAYFADGLTEELISVLSHVRGLSVIARTSVAPYKAAPKPIAQVGTELGVDTVLEGSVRKAGNRIRITLQLIDVASQAHVWANSYNRELDDVFAVQSDIAERTAEALRLELAKADESGVKRRPTASLAAYDLYLRGLVAASDLPSKGEGRRGPEEAARYFERATELDPTFAEAFAAWAEVYVVAAGDYVSMREVMPRARELVRRALELDPECSEAHAALGNIAMQFDHDWERSEAEFRRAIELNPSNVVAHHFYALLLQTESRFDEAKESLQRAIRLDPAGGLQKTLSWLELGSGNVETALADAERYRKEEPDSFSARIYAGLFYAEVGRFEEAARAAAGSSGPTTDTDRFDHALLNALVGQPDEARAVIAAGVHADAKTYTSKTHLALLHAALGERARALDLLEQEFRAGEYTLWILYRGVFFDSIRDDPRFLALLRGYGITSPTVPLLKLRSRAAKS